MRDRSTLIRRQANPDLEAEGVDHLLGEEAADTAAVDAAHELAAEPAVRQRVVGERRSPRPTRDTRRRTNAEQSNATSGYSTLRPR
jgi:hypothetical protein